MSGIGRRIGWIAVLGYGVAVLSAAPQREAPAPMPVDQQRALLDKYCVTCHNQRLKTAGLLLDKIDVTRIPENAETWEKVLLKLRGGMMPPAGMPRPDNSAIDGFTASLESQIDRAYFSKVNPGQVGLHRINRAEYSNAVRDLLGLTVDTSALLPPDDANFGFDNIADALTVSPSLLERYLTAASKISRLAVGDPKYLAGTQTFHTKADLSQNTHLEGLPLGTRGGILVQNNFPLDAEYVLKVELWRSTAGGIRGLELPSSVVITLDGERVHLASFGGTGERTAEGLSQLLQVRIPIKAGPHRVGAAFVAQSYGPTLDLLQPFAREKLDPIKGDGIPEVDGLTILGPYNGKGVSETPSRAQVFICRPAEGADQVPCAKKILSTLGRKAYRKPLTDGQMERLLSFFQRGKNQRGDFDSAIELSLSYLLSSPEFLFRSEADPVNAAPGTVHRISDLELASRMSFFLWSSLPDDELLNLAAQGKLKDPSVLDTQVRRMLADPRSEAMVSNFLGQWLYLRNLKGIVPDKVIYPDFDDNLRSGFQRETELFFGSVMHEDRSVIDLIDGKYTFVNERLAKHYGMPGIYGEQFRRVTVTDDARRGLLGQGSVLTVTSQANRTSPVLRGKYILTNILGTPPPPPPPNVPPLDEVAMGTMRERMEQHRKNPACATCHKVMDPAGLALENFDGTGHWRSRDGGGAIDASGVLVDGTKVDGPVALRRAIMSHPEQFVRTMTQMLLTYALGRGLEYYDMPVVRGISKDAGKVDYRFSALVIGIVKSPPFQMRAVKSKANMPVADTTGNGAALATNRSVSSSQ